ncbi:hypothetical protein KUW09_03945 [Mameliella alba]|nr:hypothetical protein [Antarctobacter heliothermus]MBY6143179.1 hypothetical protein [Mameliella alba]MCA0953097.1 S8 family serine peptidase [Mameliella alba]
MSHSWKNPSEHAFRDAYLDWSRLIGLRRDMLPPARPDRGPEYAPIFVRLKTAEDAQAARTALRDHVQDSDGPLRMDSTEFAALTARINDPAELAALPDEYMLYRRVGTAANAHDPLFEVIDTGCPVQMQSDAPPPGPAGPVPPTATPGAPIVAIIDDGIGFLNARFCRNAPHRKTRFHALWLQALEQHAEQPKGTLAGRIMDPDEIDTMLATGDERDAYARLNAALYPGKTRDETGFGTTHGTHVLDLAAGADPGDDNDPVRDWPLLGVQLPPESIDDTSGTWFESYLVMGLRWVLRQARQIDPDAPVIVNISLGVLAGPKDGSRFVEYQATREARLWEQATGQPVRLVWAFGNGYRSSQVATITTKGAPSELTWRAQPDDETASFAEIHCRDAGSLGLQVGLTAPDGTASGLMPMAPGEIRSLERPDGAAMARIYHVAARRRDETTEEQAHYVLALAPTRGQKTGEPEALPGAWTVTVQGGGEILLQVQRDDAIRGAEVRGRQSYLDHPAAYDWDPERAAYVAPGNGPITDAGTHSAFVTAQCRQSFCVGAAVASDSLGSPCADAFHPAAYSAQGAAWSIGGPTVSTPVGTGAFAQGLRAAGTLSGSTRRLQGTSATAGHVTRALGLSSARLVANVNNPASGKLDDIDPAYLITTDQQDARLGAAIVTVAGTLPVS